MGKCTEKASLYLAILKAIYLIHQQNHWLAKGNDFYGNHLLFQRIYESVTANLDAAAEKMVTIFGEECLDFKKQAHLLNQILLKYQQLCSEPLACSLAIEKDFIKYSKIAYDCFKQEGKLSLGLDDLIMSNASDREEAVYLLSRALDQAESED